MIAEVVPDPPNTVSYSRDPDDDHLIALGLQSGCDAIVSGDNDLVTFAGPPRVLTPRQLLNRL